MMKRIMLAAALLAVLGCDTPSETVVKRGCLDEAGHVTVEISDVVKVGDDDHKVTIFVDGRLVYTHSDYYVPIVGMIPCPAAPVAPAPVAP